MGEGRAFCAGGDVKSMAGRVALSFEHRTAQISEAGSISLLIRNTPKPIIATVNEVTVGAALASPQLAISEWWDVPHASRALCKGGLSEGWGGTWNISRLIGTAKARELYITGKMIETEEALTIGLVNQMGDDADLRSTPLQLAARDCRHATHRARLYQKEPDRSRKNDFSTACELEAMHLVRCTQTEDYQEALLASNEKRPPRFTGN